jgi:hypothetical protein
LRDNGLSVVSVKGYCKPLASAKGCLTSPSSPQPEK